MKKTIITGLAILGGVTALSTFAYQNSLGTGNQPRWGRFGSGQTMGSGQFKLPENFAAIQTAMTNKDFTAWKAAIGNNGPFVDKITTQEQFTTFIQMMDAEKSGDTTTAEKLRTELGLEKKGEGRGHGRGEGFGSGHDENFQAIQTAMTNKDFTAWKTAVGNKGPFADKITTQEQFTTFIQMMDAEKSGNTTTADKLRTELGLEKRGEGKEPRGEFGSGHNENFQAIQTAMTNKDFTAWKASVGDHNPFADKITTQELFNKFVDMDTAYKAGNTTTAEKLRTELGITKWREKSVNNSENTSK